MNTRPFVVAIVALTAQPGAAWTPYECLEYTSVYLSGTLAPQVFPGPPDYESVTRGDEPRTIWVLLLDDDVCVVDRDPRYPREYHQREVELTLDADLRKRYRNLLSHKVVVSGTLAHGDASHEKRLVLTVDSIEKARGRVYRY